MNSANNIFQDLTSTLFERKFNHFLVFLDFYPFDASHLITYLSFYYILVATATPSLLPPQCQDYTSITDGTRHVDNRNPGSDSDRLYFSSTPTWVRFEGAAGTRLADYSVPTGHCGAEATGWVKFATEPSVGETENQTVCFNWNGVSCIWPQQVPMTNCQDFFVYALVAPSLSDVVRYCTI